MDLFSLFSHLEATHSLSRSSTIHDDALDPQIVSDQNILEKLYRHQLDQSGIVVEMSQVYPRKPRSLLTAPKPSCIGKPTEIRQGMVITESKPRLDSLQIDTSLHSSRGSLSGESLFQSPSPGHVAFGLSPCLNVIIDHTTHQLRFPCYYCVKHFKNLSGVKSHEQSTHSDLIQADLSKGLNMKHSNGFKPYQCTIDGCAKRYRNPGGLKYHLLNAHKMPLLGSSSPLYEGGGEDEEVDEA